MTCDEAEILLHALIDSELDAGHAREVEDHIAGCAACAAALTDYREMSRAVAGADLHYKAPPELRRRIEASLPRAQPAPNRRAVLRGFAMGSAVSAIAATGLVAIVLRNDDQSRITSEIVSAQYSPHLPISVLLNSSGFEISRLKFRLTPRGATKKNPAGGVNSPRWL